MNKKVYLAVLFCILALSIGAFAFGMQTPQPTNAQPAQTQDNQTQVNQVPEHIVYRMFLRDLYTFKLKAEESERQGNRRSSEAYRNIYRERVGWSSEQARILDDIASECEREVKEIDAKAKKIIDARRALYYPDGKVQGGQLAPPSPELALLQEERNATILKFRDRIREAFGEQEFRRLDRFLKSDLAPTITVTAPGR